MVIGLLHLNFFLWPCFWGSSQVSMLVWTGYILSGDYFSYESCFNSYDANQPVQLECYLLYTMFMLFRKKFLLRQVWTCKFLPGMFGRMSCGNCNRPVDCKYGQGRCKYCCWIGRCWKCSCHIRPRKLALIRSDNVWIACENCVSLSEAV